MFNLIVMGVVLCFIDFDEDICCVFIEFFLFCDCLFENDIDILFVESLRLFNDNGFI